MLSVVVVDAEWMQGKGPDGAGVARSPGPKIRRDFSLIWIRFRVSKQVVMRATRATQQALFGSLHTVDCGEESSANRFIESGHRPLAACSQSIASWSIW